MFHRNFIILYALIFAAILAASAHANDSALQVFKEFDIAAQPLPRALLEFSRQSDVDVIASQDLVGDKQSNAVRGRMRPRDALERLLKGSGLKIRAGTGDRLNIVPAEPRTPKEEPEQDPADVDEEAEEPPEKVVELEDMAVVGSRLRSTSSTLPVKVITRDEIDRSGAGNIAQVLSNLSEVSVNNVGDTNSLGNTAVGNGSDVNATTVQLRGLPAGTTLVLINGRRVGESSAFARSGLFDLSTIPLALVERIEVLPAGASAVYGGDGLAGVINIVLRRDASGFEARVRRAAADGYGESQASVMWGKAWSRGELTATATWRENGTLSSAGRSLTADRDFTRFGGRHFRTTLANPGNIYSLDGCPPAPELCLVPLEDRANLPGTDAPFAAVPTGQDGQNLTPSDFANTAGVLNRISSRSNFFSPAENYSLGVNGSFQVTPGLELFTELTYSQRDVPSRETAITQINGGQFGLARAVVPASNPFNPFGVDVGVDYLFENTGVFVEYSQRYWRGLLGARGQWRQWEWELASWRSRDRSEFNGPRSFDVAPIEEALGSSDPATALNPFVGDGSAPGPQELLASLPFHSTIGNNEFGSELQGYNGFVRGPLMKLPAGEILGLVGGEYQKQTLNFNAVSNPSDIATGGDTSRAVFGEIRVPLLASRKQEGWERLALTGALRRESTKRFEEDATTETVGLEFRPLPPLMLRATYSTAYKPLIVFNALQESRSIIHTVSDPQFGGDLFQVELVSGGGVPRGLKPEISTSRTFGVVYSPEPDLRISVTHWDNQLQDRFLSSVASGFLIDNESEFPERVIRDPDTWVITQVDNRPININWTEVAGVDFALDGRWHTYYGDFLPSLATTYTYKYEEQVTPTLPVQNNLAVRKFTGWAPRWKIVPRLGWDYQDRVYATLTGRYISKYEDPQPLSTGPNAGAFLTLGDFWMFDLNVDFSMGRWFAAESNLFSGTRLSVGARNLFDRLPDFCNSCGAAGYDASQYDIVGRTVYAELRLSF